MTARHVEAANSQRANPIQGHGTLPVVVLSGFLASVILLKFSHPIGIFFFSAILYLTARSYGKIVCTVLGVWYGAMYFLALYFWFDSTGLELILIGTLLSATCFGLACFAGRLAVESKRLWLELISIPVTYHAMAYLLFWPLFRAAYLLHAPPVFPFLYAYIGSGGVHLLFMLMAISLTALIVKRYYRSATITILVCSLLFIPLLLASQEQHAGIPVTVGLVQPNIPSTEIAADRARAVEMHLAQIESLVRQDARIIVLPENVYYYYGLDEDSNIQKSFQSVASDFNVTIIYSSTRILHPRITSAKVLTPAGPFPEHISTVPYENFITERGSFVRGNTTQVYRTPHGNFVILICFEALNRRILDSVDDLGDVDYIIILANNYFMQSEFGLDTLIWNAQDIAGTYRKHVIMVSNNGPTSVIDPYGRIASSLPYNQRDVLAETVIMRSPSSSAQG